MEWGRETIEMQENGSTKNLLQMTDIYYSVRRRLDWLYFCLALTSITVVMLLIAVCWDHHFVKNEEANSSSYISSLAVLSLSLPYVTQTWREMACTRSQACRGRVTHASTPLSGTPPSSVTTREEETTSDCWCTDIIPSGNANMWATRFQKAHPHLHKMCVHSMKANIFASEIFPDGLGVFLYEHFSIFACFS